MLNRLLGRHRSLRIGATIVGASALALGVASPAFAAQNVNNGNADNANAQNNIVVMGGSNTTFLVMSDLSELFNKATGCDTVGVSPTNNRSITVVRALTVSRAWRSRPRRRRTSP